MRMLPTPCKQSYSLASSMMRAYSLEEMLDFGISLRLSSTIHNHNRFFGQPSDLFLKGSILKNIGFNNVLFSKVTMMCVFPWALSSCLPKHHCPLDAYPWKNSDSSIKQGIGSVFHRLLWGFERKYAPFHPVSDFYS